ncbi:3-oxoacyl-[acyl-carrier-protein] synthase 1 [Planctopirus ephydatiae]|uniref:3-oxoacyl-[acyl-carrier-protein] synthase 1 n=1 Tax=Planctopirus ephydatiae TaxID=2528019 RepID=A0A518GTF4_9PLAN|nr:beta-ketoacyl-[acyl-carrier-protein] synthase family protein [Planctopirus ephydatiae]QDV31863.1 3-oxoacyl-[acyl-carrier-protein] synthase 1 [Planctopirus ephydatiae]
MRRVVVTGCGIVSSIGIGNKTVATSLREGRSGLQFVPEMKAYGLRCNVAAPIVGFDEAIFQEDGKPRLSRAAQYGLTAVFEAIAEAGLMPHSEPLNSAAVILGSGGGGQSCLPETALRSDANPIDEPGIYELRRQMNETAAVAVAQRLGAEGRVSSNSAACATGLYNIGFGYELVAAGLHDCCICGGVEEQSWQRVGVSADNSLGMPTTFNETPKAACRPFDRDRQGFIISEGSAAVVLESYDAAMARGAPIYAEIVGYAAANDGHDLYVANGDAMRRVVLSALSDAAKLGVANIDYINAHATGTPIGDAIEAGVIREIFGTGPAVSSCKGVTGHSQGAVGAQEVVYTVLMLRNEFLAATANLEHPSDDCGGIDHVRTRRDVRIDTALTMNNGLGGTNAAMILRAL